MNTLTYKGYIGSVSFSEKDNVFFAERFPLKHTAALPFWPNRQEYLSTRSSSPQ